jgi:hypothetical protein
LGGYKMNNIKIKLKTSELTGAMTTGFGCIAKL